ncbi:hypothetical protein RFI_23463 [Reticulomyxa filosa]|uniref:Ion transport domain-containing protein n=1 Tax=Reticulomyxa filosa TaxID=46433 RepID=X6MJ94_RETFI|nr:hypothetical protein RFI_23463 [Reticulomyxa filosa]|eukprot:ETO13904.1 hypothetical protein RFI_23463 [Reticulomyxa filosa]
MELQQIAEEIENETHYDLEFHVDDHEAMSFSQRASEQNAQRKKMVEEWMKIFNSELAASVWEVSKPIENKYLDNKPDLILKLNRFVQREIFENFMLVIIIFNTIVLALVWPNMNNKTQDALDILNDIFTVIFTIELIMKFVGLGPSLWFHDRFNIYDAIIVLISLLDMIISAASNQPKIANVILAFRTLRVLRILRLFHRIQPLRILLNAILEAVEPIGLLFLILSLFLFMVSKYRYIYMPLCFAFVLFNTNNCLFLLLLQQSLAFLVFKCFPYTYKI